MLVAALSLVALPTRAAEITDVADAADTIVIGDIEKDDNFDLYLDVGFSQVMQNGKITREPINRPFVNNPHCTDVTNARNCLPVDELRYKRTTNLLNFGTEIGLFHDTSLSFGFHYVIGDTGKLRYAKGVDPSTSSVDSDTPLIPGGGTQYFAVRNGGFKAEHNGFGPMDIGFKFGPLNDERDDSKPAWVLYFNWANPWLEKTFDPSVRATSSSPGPIGDGVHRLTFGTSFSKRVGDFGLIGIDPNINRRGFVDPYMDFSYTLPVPQKGKALPGNITSNSFGEKPSHQARFSAGMEVVGLEDLKAGRKVAVDLGLCTAFFSEGRNPSMALAPGNSACTGQTGEYSMLVDALGVDTYTEQYFHVGGVLGLYIQAAEFIRFKIGVALGYDTQHLLTFEDVGKDKNGDGQVLDPAIDPKAVKDELNPYFCGNNPNDRCKKETLPSYDQVGFRFIDQEHVVFNWFASLMFTF